MYKSWPYTVASCVWLHTTEQPSKFVGIRDSEVFTSPTCGTEWFQCTVWSMENSCSSFWRSHDILLWNMIGWDAARAMECGWLAVVVRPRGAASTSTTR